MEPIYVTRPFMPSLEEYTEEIRALWDTKQLTNGGQKHQQLEEKLKEYLKVEQLTLFSNGHMALESALRAFDLTGEVITTPFTFASTTNAIVRCGLTPVFCDIEPERYTIDADKIEALITPKTSAIVPVHVYGNVCDVEKIETIAKKYNLKVIYDAAHAFGVEIGGRGIASYGDASVFSFHATKVYSTGEGGAVAYNELLYKDKLERQKNFGIWRDGSVELWGGNAKMSEFHAAYGLCNLRYIETSWMERKKVYNRYKKRLEGVDGLVIPQQREDAKCNYAYFPIVFEKFRYPCEMVYGRLKEKGIYARRYFYPLTNAFPCCQSEALCAETPIAKCISASVLCLPFYVGLKEEEIDCICDIILS